MKKINNQLHSFNAIDLSEDEMATYTGGAISRQGPARRLQEEFQAELAAARKRQAGIVIFLQI